MGVRVACGLRVAASRPARSASKPALGVRRGGTDEVGHPLGELALERGGLAAIDPVVLPDELPVVQEEVDRPRCGPGTEQLGEPPGQLVDGQAGAPGALGLGQHMRHPRASALGASTATPSPRAIRSAMTKPTPNTRVRV